MRALTALTRYFKNTPILLLFTFKDLFEDQIVNQRKSLSMCFEDYNYGEHRATDPCLLIVESYLATIHEHIDDMNVPPLIIHLCAVYFGGEAQFAINFVINKFKAMIPDERMDSVHIRTICTLNTEEVQSVVDEIPSFIRPEFKELLSVSEMRERARKIAAAIKRGQKQIKWLFPIFTGFMVLLAMILILTSIDMVSYIELGISSLIIIIFGIWIVKEWRQSDYVRIKNGFIEMNTKEIGLFLFISAVIWSLNVVVASLDTTKRSEWTWMLYVLFPIGCVLLYFVVIFRIFYWIEHSMWTLCWFGIMMIITGICTDIDEDAVMWIIGLCSIVLSLIVPFVVNCCVK